MDSSITKIVHLLFILYSIVLMLWCASDARKKTLIQHILRFGALPCILLNYSRLGFVHQDGHH
jgi:hypothetical protein